MLPRRGSLRRKFSGLGLMLLGLGLLSLTLARNMSPLVRELAVAGARNAATRAMQGSVARRMAAGQMENLVKLEKDEGGFVTAAVADVRRLNELQALLAEDVVAALQDPTAADLSVPLGNLLPTPLFSGLGPRIPIRILSVSEVEVKLLSRFAAAGINQTLHRLLLAFSAEVKVLIPAGTVTTRVYAEVAAAETVIVGRVPESYMFFESDDQWDDPLEKYDILS